jgi:predicted secreted acid phosphatase
MPGYTQNKTRGSFLLWVFFVVGISFQAWPAAAEPQNLGDLKHDLNTYHDSGDYDRDLAAVGARAQTYLDAHLAGVKKPAIVLDIDETTLSNWGDLKANDFGYIPTGRCSLPAGHAPKRKLDAQDVVIPNSPCGWLAWDTLATASPIAPTLAIFNDAKAKGVAIFFITGRHNAERKVTTRNLIRAGYKGWTRLIMEPDKRKYASASDFKAPERQKIEAEGYDIVLNLGDQPSDLSGGFADQGVKLPDPFYRVP